MTGQKRIEGRHRPFRSETIRDKYFDFDIYLDDSQTEIKRTREIFPDKKKSILFLIIFALERPKEIIFVMSKLPSQT